MLPWRPVKQHGCPASHLSVGRARHSKDLCSRLSANSGKYLCISCICSTLCSFSLETEFLRLFKTFETLACAQLPYPERSWARRDVPVLPFTRYQGSERSFLGHNHWMSVWTQRNCANAGFLFLFIHQTEKEAQVRSIKTRFFKSIFARWNIKQNILFYQEHKV